MVFLVEEFFEEDLFAELFRAGGWLADWPADALNDAWVAPEDFWAEPVECLEADAPAVERLPLEPLEPEFFDAVDDAECLAGWLSPEEVEATMVLDFV